MGFTVRVINSMVEKLIILYRKNMSNLSNNKSLFYLEAAAHAQNFNRVNGISNSGWNGKWRK